MNESLKCIVREHVRFIRKNVSRDSVGAIIYCIDSMKNKKGKIHFNHAILYNECIISNYVRDYATAPGACDYAIEKRLKLINEYVEEAKIKRESIFEKYTTEEWYDVITSTNEKCSKYIDIAKKSTQSRTINSRTQNMVICDRCGGNGYLPEYENIDNGVCFACDGLGKIYK